jgi:DNA primase catalytic core
MPRYYPQEEIDRVKAEISMQRLVEASGIELKRHGEHWKGLCPFHDDHEPSLIVTPKKNVWHCMGACNEGGDVIKWVMKTRGVSFRHAMELLKADHPSLGTRIDRVVQHSTAETVKLEAPVDMSADDREVLAQVVDYYHRTLKQSPEALRYLKNRGLDHPEMIDHFKLGYANRTLGYRLPAKNRKAGAEIRGRLERLGIFRAETGHEHFNGSIVIPVFDRSGAVAEMYGRKITRVLTKGLAYHLYLPGPHKGVWNEEALIASKEIILCEALIDALTFWCAGYRNVTASYGINGFTDGHRDAFRKHGVKNVWIAYDRDEAGDRAAEQLKDDLAKLGIGSHRVLFPKGMDANEYALKVTPASRSLGVLLNRAEWWQKPMTTAAAPLQKESPAKEAPVEEDRAAAKEESEIPSAPDMDLQPEIALIAESVEILPQEKPVESAPSTAAQTVEVPEPVIPLAAESDIQVQGDEITMWQGDRRYRVRGLGKNTTYEVMKVNVLVTRQEDFHIDTFDMHLDRQRAMFIKRAAEELNVNEDIIRKDVGRFFFALEKRQVEAILMALEPQKPEILMTDEERAEALALLKDPKLLDRILADLDRCGLVGEETNKLVAYIAAVSRHLESPLAVVVQSSSASGKSSLMDAVLAMMPEEERFQYSAMTGQSLYYMGATDLKHKILAIVEEEGASRASYALKLLQSEGVLSIASTGKDAATGKLLTREYRVEGPVMIFLTTTAIDIDEELLNRCLILSVNEDREQTKAIHRVQREQQTLEGLLRRQQRQRTLRLHQNAQRLLQPLTVVNPYAKELTFPDSMTRSRRDQMKYLILIRAIALVHQYQRPIQKAAYGDKTISYIEATLEDIEIANRLVEEVLGRSLDELQPQTRRLLLLVNEAVQRECETEKIDRSDFRFSRKDVRAWTRWSDSTLKRHLARLEDLEYLLVHRGGRGQTFVYELVFIPTENASKPQLPGLIHVYDLKKSGVKPEKSAPSPRQVRGVSGGGPSLETRATTGLKPVLASESEKRIYRAKTNGAS